MSEKQSIGFCIPEKCNHLKMGYAQWNAQWNEKRLLPVYTGTIQGLGGCFTITVEAFGLLKSQFFWPFSL